MSGTGLAIVMTVVVCIAVVKYWKQILTVLLVAVAAVFCVGVYHIVSILPL